MKADLRAKHATLVITRRILVILLSLFCLTLIVMTALGYYLAGPSKSVPQVFENRLLTDITPQAHKSAKAALRIMTLNLSHGRGDNLVRFWATRDEVLDNLTEIAGLIKSVNPHLIAVQEVDTYSWLTGRINHLSQLTELSRMKYAVQGKHVGAEKISYGTGFISNLPLLAPQSRAFPSTPPTLTKGFVTATISWPGDESTLVDVASVHFDFLLSSRRTHQAEILADHFQQRGHPLIILGDFNATWEEKNSVVRLLSNKLNLKAFQPESDRFPTFPTTNKRIDWILISSELEFSTYRTLPQTASDHLATLTTILPPK